MYDTAEADRDITGVIPVVQDDMPLSNDVPAFVADSNEESAVFHLVLALGLTV